MLQAAKSVQIALCGFTRATGLDELGVERENFFSRAARVTSAVSACAALIWAWARAAWLRRSASSSCKSSWPLRTWSPSFTNRCFTVVATGECASKLRMGSTLPLVEIRLRMGPRSHCGGANPQGGRPVKIGISSQRGEHSEREPGAAFPRRGPSVRIVGCCQPVIFQRAARTTASINLPLGGRVRAPAIAPAVAWLDAGEALADAFEALRWQQMSSRFSGCRAAMFEDAQQTLQ